MSSALAGEFLTTEPSGKPYMYVFIYLYYVYTYIVLYTITWLKYTSLHDLKIYFQRILKKDVIHKKERQIQG